MDIRRLIEATSEIKRTGEVKVRRNDEKTNRHYTGKVTVVVTNAENGTRETSLINVTAHGRALFITSRFSRSSFFAFYISLLFDPKYKNRDIAMRKWPATLPQHLKGTLERGRRGGANAFAREEKEGKSHRGKKRREGVVPSYLPRAKE